MSEPGSKRGGRPFRPRHSEIVEDWKSTIDMARSGEREAALKVIRELAHYLRTESRLDKDLAQYFAEALDRIAGGADPSKELLPRKKGAGRRPDLPEKGMSIAAAYHSLLER